MDNVNTKNNYSEQDIERCTLTNLNEIVFHIKSLIKRRDKISVIFQEGRLSFLTILLDVSPQEGSFYFDIGGSKDINQSFLRVDTCTFATSIDGIRIQFSVKGCRQAAWKGETVFAALLPTAMLRLQRRETFRVSLPSLNPYNCRIRRGTPREELLPIHDISVGGISILSSTPLEYEQTETLENCWVDLHENGMIQCGLEVRYVITLESRSGKPLWRMGCKFVDLRAADEMQIQRFMAHIEADRRVLTSG